ncbi:hypothetical protein F2Q68_00031282 [Brassica cretica]|uniref:Uncharacterized protein n=1 Tax=Brassica cretica TaxID=69181 RepID=A0A8S9G7B8_BRACR|nr:hypothetical protein F2Q68_00031282 [Brassica cretica]
MNSNSKTSVSGDLTSAKLINSAGEPVNRSSETANSSVVATPKRGITGDSSANAVASEARYKKRQGKAVVSSDKSDAVLSFRDVGLGPHEDAYWSRDAAHQRAGYCDSGVYSTRED